MTKRHTHTEHDSDIVDRHLEFFNGLPSEVKPANIVRTAPCSYEYDYVEGAPIRAQRHLENLYSSAFCYLWSRHIRGDVNLAISEYLGYVNELNAGLGYPCGLFNRVAACIFDASGHIVMTEMHGDLTLENVLRTQDDHYVFIDPGMVRGGLSCRQLDEAKMLQSVLTKWDILNRTSPTFGLRAPFEVEPVHIAFLITHWIRLMRHTERHGSEILEHAPAVIRELEEML